MTLKIESLAMVIHHGKNLLPRLTMHLNPDHHQLQSVKKSVPPITFFLFF